MTDAGAAATTLSMDTCEALARLARGRDSEAWTALIDRHGAAILRTAARITPDAALREDICQETLLQIRAHAGAFTPQGRGEAAELFARGWIMRIACCTALKMIRTRSRSAQRENDSAAAANAVPVATPAERAVAREEAESVRREVAGLPEAHRDAISLRYFGDLAYGEIGAILKISEEAAKKRVQRGLDLLRARLASGGVALSTALLVNVLQQGSAAAGECGVSAAGVAGTEASCAPDAGQAIYETLDLSRRAAWQALVNSSQAPALTGVVLGGGLTMGLKAGLGIAAAAVLALGAGGAVQLNATQTLAQEAAAAAAEARTQARAMETKLEGSRNEIDALRRVLEARNAELTSLRDKVAELDKRNLPGGLGAAIAGMPQDTLVRQIGDKVLMLHNKNVTGAGAPEPTVHFFTEAAVDANGNVRRELQFPGGRVVIQGNPGEFNIAVPPPPVPAPLPDGPMVQAVPVVPDAPGAGNGVGGGAIRLLPPAVVPPKPPEKQPKEKVDGNF